MLSPKIAPLIRPRVGDFILIRRNQPGEGVSDDDELLDVGAGELAHSLSGLERGESGKAVAAAVYEGGVLPIREAGAFAEEGLEAAARVLRDVAVEDWGAREAVDVARDGRERGQGTRRGYGGPCFLAAVTLQESEEEQQQQEADGGEIEQEATEGFAREVVETVGGLPQQKGVEGHGADAMAREEGQTEGG